MEGRKGIPEFLKKTYEMLNDESTDHIVSWSPSGTSFVISKRVEFCERILPLFFNHSNFRSFHRQLNKYGFRNINKKRGEYTNSNFVRGQPEIMQNIGIRPKSYSLRSTKAKQLRKEAEKLNREKRMLQIKIEKLKVENESIEEEIQRLMMNLENSEKGLESKRKKKKMKCSKTDDLSEKKGKAKLLEIDLNSLPNDSDVSENALGSSSPGFKRSIPDATLD